MISTPRAFVNALGRIRLASVFNPYRDRCPQCDRADAVARRRANLRATLAAAQNTGTDSLWIARDLGYRGGRRTGLPMTDEPHLAACSDAWGGLTLRRATRGTPAAERTATVIWETLARVGLPIFLWNIFPLHPHAPDAPLSNRCHTTSERQACRDLLFELLEILQPRRLVAIGKDAQHALDGYGLTHHPVRHPSYGGQRAFIEGVTALYGIRP